jgi:sugar/nucleoside kinase (ribokinase family)
MIDRKQRVHDLMQYDMQYRTGEIILAGMDEVGRGPLAGSVVTACVVMPEDPVIRWIDDSKKLSETRREMVYDEIIACARRLREQGAVNVLVSRAKDGALLVDENDQVHTIGVAKGTVVNSVGAGDSMVAGFLGGYLKTGDYAYALKLGTACGGATAFHSGLATAEQIEEVLKSLK